ncbi:hypothetical protein IIB79_08560 [candidate division KSB1 bacterium]|nr:hypothetical protein [candidate division KSB1 bacterium]
MKAYTNLWTIITGHWSNNSNMIQYTLLSSGIKTGTNVTGSDDRANYRVTVEIESRKKEGILLRIFQRIEKDIVSVSSTYSSATNRALEHVSFDISGLEPAEYELRMTVTDLLSGQYKTRIGMFIVVN